MEGRGIAVRQQVIPRARTFHARVPPSGNASPCGLRWLSNLHLRDRGRFPSKRRYRIIWLAGQFLFTTARERAEGCGLPSTKILSSFSRCPPVRDKVLLRGRSAQ
jgi:hypothetical protein